MNKITVKIFIKMWWKSLNGGEFSYPFVPYALTFLPFSVSFTTTSSMARLSRRFRHLNRSCSPVWSSRLGKGSLEWVIFKPVNYLPILPFRVRFFWLPPLWWHSEGSRSPCRGLLDSPSTEGPLWLGLHVCRQKSWVSVYHPLQISVKVSSFAAFMSDPLSFLDSETAA